MFPRRKTPRALVSDRISFYFNYVSLIWYSIVCLFFGNQFSINLRRRLHVHSCITAMIIQHGPTRYWCFLRSYQLMSFAFLSVDVFSVCNSHSHAFLPWWSSPDESWVAIDWVFSYYIWYITFHTIDKGLKVRRYPGVEDLMVDWSISVSYTHLTLPTIYSV